VSVSPLSPLAAQDSVQPCLQHVQHSTSNQMTHISESPSSEEVDHCTQLSDVRQSAGADIPPDSPIRSMFVIHLSFDY